MASSQSNQHTVHNNTNPPPPPALVRVHLNRPHTQSLRTAQTQSAHLIPIPSASTTTHNNDLLKMKRYVSALSRSNPRLALNSLNWLYSLRLTPNVTVALINFGIINKLLYLFAPLTSSVSSLPPMHAVPTTTTIRLEVIIIIIINLFFSNTLYLPFLNNNNMLFIINLIQCLCLIQTFFLHTHICIKLSDCESGSSKDYSCRITF